MHMTKTSPWLVVFALLGCAGNADVSDGAVEPATDLGESALADLESARPAVTTLRVHYPLPASGSLSVRGSLSPLSWTSGATMTQKSDTVFELQVRGLKAPLEWKPLFGDMTWSRGSNYIAQPGQTVDIYPHFISGKGRYVRHLSAFHSTVLGNNRGVWLYLPPSFDENPLARYPVVYMHDGQNLFDPRAAFGGRTWQVSETLDAGIDALDASLHIPEVVVVGPENAGAQRIFEYTPTPDAMYMDGGGGDLYLRFLRDELKPAIEKDALLKDRLLTDREHTALAGSSLGGLISAYGGLRQPDIWSRLGIFSPSTWWDDGYILNQVAAATGLTPRWSRVYVDSGSPSDDTENTAKLAAKYRALGYSDGSDFKYVLAPGAAHNEDAWAARLPAALRFLCGGW